MAILESDYMDFGNGIIGDDTFDIWRKKTNSLKVEIDDLNTSLTNKINTDFGALPSTYIPIAGSAKQVSTLISFTSTPKLPNATTVANSLDIGGTTLYSAANTLQINHAVTSASTLKGTKLEASSQIKFGTKDYSVPSAPSSLSILQSNVAGQMSWVNPADAFANAGGLQQTTAVFEEIVPVGSIIPWASAEPPTGGKWLVCNGGSFSAAALPDLAAELGDTYGVHNGDTYYLPDFSGRVSVGAGIAGSVNFGSVGSKGGTSNTSTASVTLSIDQIPAHAHKFFDDRGNAYVALNDSNLGAAGDAFESHGPNETGNNDTGVIGTTYTGGGAAGGIDGGNTTDGDLSSLSGTSPHSHTLTPGSRVQPYLTINYIIKAKTDSKIDFKIDLQDSGLIMQDSVGVDGDNITPVNETVKLKINPETTAFRIDNDGKLAFATGTVLVPASLSVTGVDFKLRNETRAGGNSHSGRALVHGNGSSIGDPVLNGYDRKSVTTLNDIGGFGANDTLIINYSDISPNSVGDYTGGVVINGTKAIMFEDGTILNSAQRKGDAKKMMARQKGATGVTGRGLVAFIDDDDQPRITGYTSEYKAYNTMLDQSYGWNNDYLPDEEEAEEVYLGYYHVSCVTKTGKIFGHGWSNIFGDVENTETDGQHAEWCRSFTSDNSVKFYDSSVTSIDTGIVNSPAHDARSCYALDTNGLLWGTSDADNTGQLARGGLTDINDEVSGNAEVLLSQKRDELAGSIYNYSATSSNRLKVPHVMNPLATATGVLTTNPATATNFKVTFTKAIAVGGTAYNVIAAAGSDGLIYTAGYNAAGACGAGNVIDQLHWNTVKTAGGAILNNVVEIYGRGFNPTLFAKTANGDIYGWGHNGAYELGDGTPTNRTTAIRIWDAAAKGASGKIYTSGSGRSAAGDFGGVSYIVTEHSQPQLWAAGSSNHYGPGQQGDIEDVVYTTWKRVTSGPWNTATHTVQNFYNCGGQSSHANPNYCIALNNAAAKLELWVTGYGGEGATGITYSGQGATTLTDAGGYNGSTTKWERIRYINDRFLRKVVDIYPMHQNSNTWASSWHQHTIHLNDGRLFGVGRWPYGGLKDAYADDYFYKWQELNTLA
jgi:microcystin-dependent protein